MKTQVKNLLTAILFFTLLVSCSRSNDDENNSVSYQTFDVNLVQNTAQSGDWRITYFYDSNRDETGYYSGYRFTFNPNGTVIAVNGETEINGVWSIYNDSDDNYTEFNIFFATPYLFEEISDDWVIKTISDTKIELIDDSHNDNDIDYLTFEKI